MGMPMADYFAPDINFVPARAVYPTADGGTLASAGGAMTANTTVLSSDVVGGINTSGAPTVASAPQLSSNGKGLWWWAGFLGFLLVMVWVARKAGGEEDFRNIRPTFYNFAAITLTAIVGIVGLKVLAARWRIPGASELILAV